MYIELDPIIAPLADYLRGDAQSSFASDLLPIFTSATSYLSRDDRYDVSRTPFESVRSFQYTAWSRNLQTALASLAPNF